jgi:CheY-like chemotaxis protein/tetratricopeptide (TPR) repeat protein
MMGRTNSCTTNLRFVLALALVMACGITASLRAEEDKVAQTENLFRQAVDLYQQGKYSDAQQKLKEVLALDPRKELAARLVDEAGVKIMARMMADVRMGNEPTYIWQYYRQYNTQKRANKERMIAMAKRVVDPGTSEDERAMLYREFAELGHWAVPYLAPYLKDATHEDQRTYARIAIARMGSRAVLPLIALMGHKDVLMRENAVLTLSDITPLDPRAIPALKGRIEDAGEQPAVKHYAERTLKRITGLEAAAWKSAAEYYYELSNRYYLDRPGVAEEAEELDGKIWHLNGEGELAELSYPLWAWNDQMAEDVCLQGMAAYPEHAPYYPLWACIQGEQYTKVKDLLDIVNEQPNKNTFSAEEKKEIETWDQKLVHTKRLAYAVGKEHVNLGLHKVQADLKKYPGHTRVPQVGVFLARALTELDPHGNLLTPPPPVIIPLKPNGEPVTVTSAGSPITIKTQTVPVNITVFPAAVQVEAMALPGKGAPVPPETAAPAPVVSDSALVTGMDCPDEGIQYACAIALADLNRFPAKWIGSEKVASILARGVSENKAIQILLVDEDQNKLNEMRERLINIGYGVTTATSGRYALVEARSFPPKDIAIIAENLRRDFTFEQLSEELRADPRTRYLPVGVLHWQKDRQLVQSRLGAETLLVEREMSGDDLKAAAKKIEDKRAAESVNKRKAKELSEACAQRLAKVDPNGTHITLNDAVEACAHALINREDTVRNPAAIFLGRVTGGAKKELAAEKLLAVFEDDKNAVELRRNALHSLGLVQWEGTVGPKKVEEIYLKSQADPDQQIKDIGASDFGQLSRAAKLISDFVHQERIEREKKEK